jgi:glycosyltransferase involved in cell wall biosynthesis
MRILYIPLEPLQERYTAQWSGAKTGWLERNWIGAGIDYVRIGGERTDTELPTFIKSGAVLDARGRTLWAFRQIEKLLEMGEAGQITDSDVILFDDFWHPGMEALRYAFDQWRVTPRMFAFLHAQSVDLFDFTAPMAEWMRHFERGNAAMLDGIFTSCSFLGNLIVRPEDHFGPIANHRKVWVTGHPFSTIEVASRMPYSHPFYKTKTCEIVERRNRVIYSSRWDREKNPIFFLHVANYLLSHGLVPDDTQFVVCSSAPKLRSNEPYLLSRLQEEVSKNPRNFVLMENLTKEQYYGVLQTSKIQFNCALQDFVAISLLEASVAGCYPVYPKFRSFPETFQEDDSYMYKIGDVEGAASLIAQVMGNGNDPWYPKALSKRAWIHERFAATWLYQYKIMKASSERSTPPPKLDMFMQVSNFANPVSY